MPERVLLAIRANPPSNDHLRPADVASRWGYLEDDGRASGDRVAARFARSDHLKLGGEVDMDVECWTVPSVAQAKRHSFRGICPVSVKSPLDSSAVRVLALTLLLTLCDTHGPPCVGGREDSDDQRQGGDPDADPARHGY